MLIFIFIIEIIIFSLKDVNSWVKIGQNVDFKLGDHKGDREITEMRQALLNKIEDEKTKK